MVILDLEQQLVFYGAYHMHPRNILIHIVFVPQLMFGLFFYASLLSLGDSPVPYVPFNLSTLGAVGYSLFYMLLEPIAGTLVTPYVMAQSFVGSWLAQAYPQAVWWVAYSQVVGWVTQFIGHGVFEKKAPALLDSLIQSFALAPFFVWMEVLFMMGYRPELHARVQDKILKQRKKMDEGKARDGNA